MFPYLSSKEGHFISVLKPTVVKYLYLFCFVLLCFIFVFVFLFPLVMGIKPRALCILGAHSTTELYLGLFSPI